MPEFAVILPAAGSSSRFRGFDEKKPFVDLNGIPVWQRTVNAFLQRTDVMQIVLVLAQSDYQVFADRHGTEPPGVTLTIGGDSRADSVRNGLKSLNSGAEFVAVHDAARPLVSQEVIDHVFATATKTGAAVPCIPVTSTVKQINSSDQIERTVDRSRLRLAQTPQTFAASVLQNAFAQAGDQLQEFTDEASLVEAAGHQVTVTAGNWRNIKITTADDFHLAQLLVSEQFDENAD